MKTNSGLQWVHVNIDCPLAQRPEQGVRVSCALYSGPSGGPPRRSAAAVQKPKGKSLHFKVQRTSCVIITNVGAVSTYTKLVRFDGVVVKMIDELTENITDDG
jgi:hypothetical protein